MACVPIEEQPIALPTSVFGLDDPEDALRVGLDLTGARRRRLTGWERFALEYASALERFSPQGCVPVPLAGRHRPGGRIHTHLDQLIRYAWTGRREADRAAVDVFHALTFPPGKNERPTVWTLHDDLALGGHPEHARAGSRIWVPLARRALTWIDRLVTDTRSVANDLIELGVAEEAVRVVTPGVPELGPPVRPHAEPVRLSDGRPVEVPDEFLLAVGTIEERKRPELVAKVAEQVGVPVIFVGRVDPAFKVGRWPRHALRLERISDRELSWLYRRASVFLALSSYEGLDFPLLEALSVGTPAVASDIPVHRELVAGSAALVETDDPSVIAEAARGAEARPGITLPDWPDCVEGYQRVYAELI